MDATLLVELRTEELPPKPLKTLGDTFGREVAAGLARHQLARADAGAARVFATPRRLGVAIPGVLAAAADRRAEVTGPSVKVGLDANGKPTAALAGFARKNGVEVAALEQRDSPKGKVFVARITVTGSTLDAVLAEVVSDALKKLPIPKVMRWGDGDAEFVRPAHGLVMMHGSRVVPGRVLGLDSGNRTRGHRFMGKRGEDIIIAAADAYEEQLAKEGMVVADFAARRAAIDRLLQAEATRLGASLGGYQDLLEEVTALVEHPSVYVGEFDPQFLAVPPECLILTMRQNQKYFPLFDAAGKLTARFLIVANMRVADPRNIVTGNQRVVRPRLDDARFFYNQDRKARLESRVPQLAKVVYHNKLGTQLERVERIQLLAGDIARRLGADAALAERAAWLAKADLLTGMVGEFPELQGIMGAYYAKNDGEPDAVVSALRDQYRLRLEDDDPGSLVSACLYLADRIELLVGMFAVGNAPTGEKDPFALRRAALGVISVYELFGGAANLTKSRVPDLREFIDAAAASFADGVVKAGTVDTVYEFVLERYRNSLASTYSKDAIDAVVSQRPHLAEVVKRVRAVEEFRKLPEADSLAAANKRIRNILQKSPPASSHAFSQELLAQGAEQNLYAAFQKVEAKAVKEVRAGRFSHALSALSELKNPVDAFFDGVMVNVDDPNLRNNRLMLLKQLDGALNRVADISRLAA